MIGKMPRIVRHFFEMIPAQQYRDSFAFHQLDKRLEPYLGKRRGFFVEAGANDGVNQSNTLYFEKYLGWNGLLIEPVPDLYLECKRKRPNCLVKNCALVGDDYDETEILITDCGLMSSVAGAFGSELQRKEHIKYFENISGVELIEPQIAVPAQTLSSVLDEYQIDSIDLLSLDVEGYEPSVLRGLDFDRHTPAFIVVECRSNSNLDEILLNRYKKVAILQINDRFSDVLYERL